jgi:O-antigen/teichoic acid export membrane protein
MNSKPGERLSRKKTTAWNLTLEYVVIVISIVSRIILVPLYLRYVPLDVYGAWLATGNVLVWLTAIDPGLSSILQQRIAAAYGKMDIQEIQGYVGSGLLLSILISILIIISGLIISNFMISWLRLPSSIDTGIILHAFRISLIGSVLMIFSFSIIAVNRGFQSGIGVGSISAVMNLLSVGVTVILLLRGFGLYALAAPSVINGSGLILANLVYMRWRFHKGKIPFRFSLNRIGVVSKFMSVTFVARLANVVSKNVDLFVIGRYLGPEAVASFNLTRRGPEMSQMFVERPATAFMPAISHLTGSGEMEKARAVLLRLMRMMIWLLGIVVGGFIAFNGDFVRLWVGSHLFAGQTINVLFCFGLLLSVVTISLGNLCFALGNIKGNSIATFAQAVLSLPLILLGAKHLGSLGVALAPIIATLAVTAWYFPLSFSRLLKLKPEDCRAIGRELIAVLTVTVPLTLCGVMFQLGSWSSFSLVVSIYAISYVAGLYALSANLRMESRHVFSRLSGIAKPLVQEHANFK